MTEHAIEDILENYQSTRLIERVRGSDGGMGMNYKFPLH